MGLSINEELLAQEIGLEMMKHLTKEKTVELLSQRAESRAVQALKEIQAVLDREALDDLACFQRIEEIVEIFLKNGIYTSRHDFG